MSRMIAMQSDAPVILAPNGRPAFIEAIENNWYEASRFSPNRSYIWFPVQSAKKDLDRFTRLELSRRARYLYKNSPLIRAVIERMVTLIVGGGFTPVPKSDDAAWNKRWKAAWKIRARNMHLGARATWNQYVRAVVRARLLDGEGFSVLTADTTINFENLIQGIEAERIVGRGGDDRSADNDSSTSDGVVDGFNLNSQGIVESYNVRGVKIPVDARFVVHHFTPERLGQYRGATVLAAAINTAHDIDDILALEKQAVKDASAKKDIIKTATGQLDPETFRNLRYGGNGTPTLFSLPADNDPKDDYYRVQFGAQPVVLKKGDEYTPYKPDRPGSAWQGFIDFLTNTVGGSTGFPISVIFPINIGGTDVRRDLDIAQKVVEPIQLDVAAELDQLVDHLMYDEITSGSLKSGLPTDYGLRSWQFPVKVNVDRSQAQQDREDVARGLMSLEEYHGRYGDDELEVEESIINAAKRRKAAIQTAGFQDTKEFVEIISLDSKMFMTRSQDDEGLSGKTPTAPAAKGKTK